MHKKEAVLGVIISTNCVQRTMLTGAPDAWLRKPDDHDKIIQI